MGGMDSRPPGRQDGDSAPPVGARASRKRRRRLGLFGGLASAAAAALALLGRDPAERAGDVQRLARLLIATRPATVQAAGRATAIRTTRTCIPVQASKAGCSS